MSVQVSSVHASLNSLLVKTAPNKTDSLGACESLLLAFDAVFKYTMYHCMCTAIGLTILTHAINNLICCNDNSNAIKQCSSYDSARTSTNNATSVYLPWPTCYKHVDQGKNAIKHINCKLLSINKPFIVLWQP